jgi:hypothetical protein
MVYGPFAAQLIRAGFLSPLGAADLIDIKDLKR